MRNGIAFLLLSLISAPLFAGALRAKYSVSLSSEWSIEKDVPGRLSLRHPDGSWFDAAPLPPPSEDSSLEEMALTAEYLALANGFCQRGGVHPTKVELNSPEWSGIVIHCNNPNVVGRPGSQLILLTIFQGGTYHVFMWGVMRQDWASGKDGYLEVLRTVRVRT